MLVDLHSHSRYSDGLPSIEQIEAKAIDGQFGVCVTDHNEIRGAVELCERDRVPSIPGIEVGTREGFEFLVYFSEPSQLEQYYREAVEPDLRNRFMVRSRVSTIACVSKAKERGAFVSLAHPFAFGRKSLTYKKRKLSRQEVIREMLPMVDAIEIHNGGIPQKANRKASAYNAENNFATTAGSDAHRLADLGTSGIAFEADFSSRAGELFAKLPHAVQNADRTEGSSSIVRTVTIIMRNHSLFFFRGRKRWRR